MALWVSARSDMMRGLVSEAVGACSRLGRSILHVDKEWLERILGWKASLDKEVDRQVR